MKKTISTAAILLIFAAGVAADRDAPAPVWLGEDANSQLIAGAEGLCSIVYYNTCSGWGWHWAGLPGEEIGVVFDLPEMCQKASGAWCTNTHFWWYWRYTQPTRWFTSYRLYEVDDNDCLVGAPIAETGPVQPIERWNFHNGIGTFNADRVALVAVIPGDPQALLRVSSDNNEKNIQFGCAPAATTAHSFWYGVPGATRYCPPVPITDPAGPVNLLVKGGFDCQITSVPGSSQEESSWGAVKGLFR